MLMRPRPVCWSRGAGERLPAECGPVCHVCRVGMPGPIRLRPVRRRAWASVDARRRVRSAVRRRCRSTPDSLAGAAGLASNVRVRRNAAPTHAGDGQGGVARREQGRGGSLAWRESRVAGVSYVYEKGESYKFLVVLKTLLLVARMPGEGAQKGPGERGGLTGRPPCEILGL